MGRIRQKASSFRDWLHSDERLAFKSWLNKKIWLLGVELYGVRPYMSFFFDNQLHKYYKLLEAAETKEEREGFKALLKSTRWFYSENNKKAETFDERLVKRRQKVIANSFLLDLSYSMYGNVERYIRDLHRIVVTFKLTESLEAHYERNADSRVAPYPDIELEDPASAYRGIAVAYGWLIPKTGGLLGKTTFVLPQTVNLDGLLLSTYV